MTRTLALACVGLVVLAAGGAPSGWAAGASSGPGARSPAARSADHGGHVDAAELYNAGTDALERGDLGPAVAFLRAAERIDPRAADLRRNLAEARARASAGRDGAGSSLVPPALPLPVTADEGFWLAAALLALGAALAGSARLSRHPDALSPGRRRLLLLVGLALIAAGLLAGSVLGSRAREEALHPEAVVVVPALEVGPAPDERPRPPYLFGAGEEVRLGRARGPLVEIVAGGSPIGWAQRSGVWRVGDAARYTPRLR